MRLRYVTVLDGPSAWRERAMRCGPGTMGDVHYPTDGLHGDSWVIYDNVYGKIYSVHWLETGMFVAHPDGSITHAATETYRKRYDGVL